MSPNSRQAEKDPRAHNYMKFSYGKDDTKKIVWRIRDTSDPVPDPVCSDTEIEATRALVRAEETAPSPANFFSGGNWSLGSDLEIEGPFDTLGGVYWKSTTKEPMKCPPPKSPRYNFPPGAIWVNTVLPSKEKEAVRQAFIWGKHEEWTDVPGQAIENSLASLPHPVLADRWFSMKEGKPPQWLKYDTIAKQRREKRKAEGLRDDELVAAGKAIKRVKLVVEPNPTARPLPQPEASVIDPTSSTPTVRAVRRRRIKIVVPNGDRQG
ncbi:hypothetical protein V5O48_001838 [Marasmius crinis-equi]|uniref:Uncharacterized protein n=1 Tax=Marasmius crinis-equi TaxID=585013 RepID=A0ABR3FXB1_9AGAR